jgi:hypothetical protein
VRPGFRWKYPTHEVLTGPSAVVALPFTVTHTSPPERRSHHRTNLATLAQAVV